MDDDKNVSFFPKGVTAEVAKSLDEKRLDAWPADPTDTRCYCPDCIEARNADELGTGIDAPARI